MDFRLVQAPEGYGFGFTELLKERGYHCEGGIEVTLQEAATETIRIAYADGKAEITASEKAFLFRGLMTLVMKLEKNGEAAFTEEETVQFDHNGSMVDSSRNCVMSVEAVKAWIRMQASVGMNTLMLYTEDTYEVPGYPYFGALRGRYTAEELKEMDAYGVALGVELIPCIQSLGHLQQPLLWAGMSELRDTSDIVCVGDEKVYAFIRACIHQVAQCFSTRKVHLGMDEAWSLGLGRYLLKNGYTPKREIIRKHMARVMDICREEGLEPMIWSDMYFRVHSKNEQYYDVPFDTDMKSGERPPEGMALVYWDYYHLDEDYYCNYMRMHRDLTDRVVFAGGGWTWKGFAPDLKVAEAVTVPALNACRKEQIRDVIYTLWGDDSTETPLFSALGPVLLCAEYGFGETPDTERIKERFEFLTGCDYEVYQQLGRFEVLTEGMNNKKVGSDPAKCLFQQDLLLGIFDGQTEGVHYGPYYAEIANALPEQVKGGVGFWGSEMAKLLEYYHVFAVALAKKADMGLRILEAYQKKDLDTLKQLAEKEIPELAVWVEKCRRLRELIWMREGKVFGWEVLDIRFRAMSGRMESVCERVLAYVNGTIPSLPELEEERIPAFPAATGEHRMEGGWMPWVNLASPSPMACGWLPQ